MSKPQLIVGLDIGSSVVRTVIAEYLPREDILRIVGVGQVQSAGMRRGAIVDHADVIDTVNQSLDTAEKMAGRSIHSVYLGTVHPAVTVKDTKGVVAIGRADGEVSEDDVNRVLAAAQAISVPLNTEIIHIIPKEYRLDDLSSVKEPIGMRGVRLEADAMVVEAPAQHIKDISECVGKAQMDIEEIVLSPLAAALSVLDKKQKELGVALVDFGGTTTSVSVFEEGVLQHVAILPIGAAHITNDIAIGIRSSVEIAEKIKKTYGTALPKTVDRRAEIDLSDFDPSENGMISHYHLAEIIEARLEEMFSMVKKELESIGKSGKLPSGVVLTGGGANLPYIVEKAKMELELPAKIGYPVELGGVLDKVDNPSFATVVGLILWGQEQYLQDEGMFSGGKVFRNMSGGMSGSMQKAKNLLSRFLP